MLAIAGVSDVHVTVVTIVPPDGFRTVAKIWSWNPTGSAGSLGVRPVNVMTLPPGVPPPDPLQAPNVDVAGASHAPAAVRCSDSPIGDDDSDAPISAAVFPAAGPSVAANVPSYDRNSTTSPLAFTS